MKLVVAVSQVGDGDMSILYSGEEVAMANRRKFIAKHGLDFDRCVHTYVKHKEDIREATSRDGGKFLDVDGLVTGELGVGLVIVTADCIPMVFANDNRVAVVHVSRKNVGIVTRAVEIMGKNVQVWLGPSIKKESYVWPNRNDLGPEWDEFVEKKNDGWHIDLVGRVIREIANCKLSIANVDVSSIDTGKDPNYFSHHRAMQISEQEGRFMTVAVMN